MSRKSHPLYKTWIGMRTRCSSHLNYAGRGITICDRWDDFNLFVEDMGERPEGYSLERVDNDGNYEPSNCVWASRQTQANNRRMRTVVNSNPMNCIRPYPYGFRVSIRLLPAGSQHHKAFSTLEEAIDYRDLCDYERKFYRALTK